MTVRYVLHRLVRLERSRDKVGGRWAGRSLSSLTSFLVGHVTYPSIQFVDGTYVSTGLALKFSILAGLILLYFDIVPRPWKKLHWLYKEYRD
jgi:hypothetical protein